MIKQINLDCDGTFVDLYSVDNWLDKLTNSDASPYADAKPLVNLSSLARTLNKLQRNGYKICVISWLSKGGSDEYNKEVSKVKRHWLKKHLPSVKFDNISIVPYGTPKSTCGSGYLFDDEEQNREEWKRNGGVAFPADNLLGDLRKLVQVAPFPPARPTKKVKYKFHVLLYKQLVLVHSKKI